MAKRVKFAKYQGLGNDFILVRERGERAVERAGIAEDARRRSESRARKRREESKGQRSEPVFLISFAQRERLFFPFLFRP
jgi:hypothetical protein